MGGMFETWFGIVRPWFGDGPLYGKLLIPIVTLTNLAKTLYFIYLRLQLEGIFSYPVHSMRFELPYCKYKSARCFTKEINKNSMVVGKYSIVDHDKLPPNYTISVEVSTHGDRLEIFHFAENVQLGQFSFTAYTSEPYFVCFMDTINDPKVRLSIDFEMKAGVKTLDRLNILKRSQIDGMAREIQILHETALSIHEEMSYLLQRNTEMLELNWITGHRMFSWIFISFFVTFLVTGLQQ
ncbi:transmembrane emp24 domain-containing protein p24delta9-like [Vicia villosa]|uniref:transmembrane emp24 domain-containing protein p24delta9-like n=1 Tax=Vicia villosa TaxID=3911 RepID=UPI00273A8DA6|nr:transmembrane emp24 domain-containing protein p24delta9-like [Vicia villosa]